MKNRLLFALVATLLVFVFMLSAPAGAQTVNASLGGIVSDATGARLPGLSVTLVNAASHDTRKTVTNSAGIFQFNAVPSGTYTLEVRGKGFSALSERGIELHPNDAVNLSGLKMAVGEMTQEITINSETALPTSGERSSLITANDIKRLATVGRDVGELLKTQPGFAILQSGLDNGSSTDPSVVGSAGSGLGNYVGNGALANGTSVFSDGANVTDPGNGSGQTQTVNMDMVAEVKIETSNFGADTAKGPTVITAVGKSGTDTFHGSAYLFLRMHQMNANDWFIKYLGLPALTDRYLYPGFNVSGPVVIPGTNFNSRKKLTFFLGAEDYIQRNVYSYGSPLKSYINALVPTQNMRNGNFTQAELANYLGTTTTTIQNQCNASGTLSLYLHVCAAPTSGSTANNSGSFVGGQYTGSFDPGSLAMLSVLPLPNIANTNGFNWQAINTENPDNYQIRTRIDYAFNDNNKIYGVYNAQYGFTSRIPEQIYYSPSAGSTQMGGVDTPGKINSRDVSNTASMNYTHIFSARATNELFGALSYVANYYDAAHPNSLLKSSIGYPYHGLYPNATKQYPQLSDYGVHGLPLGIFPDFSNGQFISRKFIPSAGDNFSYLWKQHTLKFGFYFERDTANQTDLSPVTNGQITEYYVPSGTNSGANGSVVNPVTCGFSGCGANYLADFMLGYIDQFFQQNFNPRTNLHYTTVSWFGQDTWKATRRLTLDFGVRFDHLGPWTDSHNLGISVFNPALYASDPKTPGTLPGVRWHGDGKPGSANLPLSGSPSRFVFVSPRFGVAYDMYGDGKTVVRGGWGMYRSHDSWNDYSPAAATAQGLIIASAGGAGISLAQVDNSAGALVCDASGTTACPSFAALDPTDDQQPLTMTYSLTVSQRMPWQSVFEIAYVGNQSHHVLTDAVSPTTKADIQNVNAIPIGGMFRPDPNPASSSFGQVIYPGSANASQQNDYRPYPFYTNIQVPRHLVYGNYNALQVSWNKQKGRLNYGLNYTWSKAQGIKGGYNNGLSIDPTNYRANYGPLAFDRTHVASASYSYDEGRLFDRRGFIGGLINNWFISGITQLQSGPNLQAAYNPDLNLQGTTTTSVNGALPPSVANGAFSLDSLTLLGTPDVYLMPTLKCDPTTGLAKNQYVNGNCFGIGSYGVNGPSNLGNLRGPGFFASDLSVQRRFIVFGGKNIELRASAFNFLNHPITAFSSRFTQEATLQMHGNSFADASLLNGGTPQACSVKASPCFGYAGYKTGRRVLEISGRFNF